MDKKLIVANWKMKPESLAEAKEILDFTSDYLGSLADSKNLNLVLCPPFVFIEEVAKMIETTNLRYNTALGAQDISIEDSKALTGEISGPMLTKLKVSYAIVGHSERRWKLGESDKTVNEKLKAVLRNGMTPIICVGEKSREGDYDKFLKDQISGTFDGVSEDEISRCLIAYEPVWAISTNPGAKPDTPQSAVESINIIKETFKNTGSPKLYLYGGSVNAINIEGFLKEQDVDGVLIGGASVKKDEFVKILEIVSKMA